MHSSTSNKPVLLTCGDPNGIGLDISALAFQGIGAQHPFVLIADAEHIAARAPDVNLNVIEDLSDLHGERSENLTVLHHTFPEMPSLDGIQYGNAQATIDVINRAVSLILDKKASAVVTNPIHKHVLQKGAGFEHPGHTEYLAHLGGVQRSVMMLANPKLRVVPATIHIALDQVPITLTKDLLRETISITINDLKGKLNIAEPRIAVAGLNPHAGENGAFGQEELETISPVIDEFQKQGVNIFGPLSADTLFHDDARENYDCAICMYHDQALIPSKTLDFHGGVNVTLGLPFIRTSPDHGTAFDLAGTNKANPQSLINAIKLAHQLAQ